MADHFMRYEIYVQWIKRGLLFIGLWPGHATSDIKRIVIFHIITCIITGFSILNFTWNHLSNLTLATSSIGIALGFVGMLLKVFMFLINWDNIRELHYTLDTNFGKDLANPELRPILLGPVNFFWRTSLWLTMLTLGSVFVILIMPPILVIIQLSHHDSTIKHILPFPSQFPWSVAESSSVYAATYIMEICGGIATGGIAVSTDSLFGLYMFQMTSQYRALAYRMNNLKATDDYCGVIKECATRHRILMHCRDHIDRIFGPFVLWIMVVSALMICGNIYQSTKISIAKAIPLIAHTLMKLGQTYLYGWYGSQLSSESESFRESVYFSGWTDISVRSSLMDVCIMLSYRPLVLTACQFFIISVDMFVAVSNTAISYFFLMRFIESN